MGAYLLVLLLLSPVSALAGGPQDAVAEARRLRDNGRFAEAVTLLDAHLQQHPDDVEAARLRAQTLYWLKDFDAARAAYAAALERHPDHEALRVEFARMLAETGERREARALLEPGLRRGQGPAGAAALLGTILYWEGDFAGAKRNFVEALRLDPSREDAARQLREIRLLASPWLRVTPVVWHDDQPLDKAGVAFEAGWFFTPLSTLTARSEPMRHSAGSTRTSWLHELEVSHVAAPARVETRLGVGAFQRPSGQEALEWTGHASLGLRFAPGVTLRGRVERAPYLNTVASLDTAILARTASGTLHVDTAGWLGEASAQRQVFPDENAVQSAYAWLLAPVARRAGATLQAGYAVAAADAREDRFVLARPQQPFPPSDPRFDFSGVYRPYYTPARILTQSVVSALTVSADAGPVLRAGGSYGFRAREDATTFEPSGAEVLAVIARRDFTPWTLRASLEIPASRAFTISIGGETGRTAHYRWAAGQVHLTYRFVPSGGADRRRQ